MFVFVFVRLCVYGCALVFDCGLCDYMLLFVVVCSCASGYAKKSVSVGV